MSISSTNEHLQFSSSFWAGFECTYALVDSQRKVRFDLLAGSQHDVRVQEDYAMIKEIGIRTVREGLAWHQIDKGHGQYDFSRFVPMIKSAQQEGIQQIWDLNHFDYPEYLDPFSDEFVSAFTHYARAAYHVLRKHNPGQLFIVPLNEISFFSYIGADSGWWAPFTKGSGKGSLFKQQLVKAALGAMKTIWELDPSVRFIHVDPIMRRIAKDQSDKKIVRQTSDFNAHIRFETWDMIAGMVKPELGGDLKYLDILGINYYMVNQEWLYRVPERKVTAQIMIPPGAPERIGSDHILQEIYDRYQRPMVVTETGSHGEFRPWWWETVLSEIETALNNKLPIYGVCAYPVLDKPTEIPFLWPQSGLWDFYQLDKTYPRQPHQESLDIIKKFILQHP